MYRHLFAAILFAILPFLHAQEPDVLPLRQSAAQNSFHDVVSQLDAGGEFLVYWTPEKAIARTRRMVETWSAQLAAAGHGRHLDTWLGFLQFALVKSGIDQLAGVGASAIRLDKELGRARVVFQRQPGVDPGPLWRLFGQPGVSLTFDRLLPPDTIIGFASRHQLAATYRELVVGYVQSDPSLQRVYERAIAELSENGWPLETLLDSLGDEIVFGLTASRERRADVPTPRGQVMTIPELGIVVAIRVKDTALHDRLVKGWETPGHPVAEQTHRSVSFVARAEADNDIPGLPMQPAIAQVDGCLLMTSTPQLMRAAIDRLQGQAPGLEADPLYQRLSAALPADRSQMLWLSPRLSELTHLLYRTAGITPDGVPDGLRLQPPHGLGCLEVTEGGYVFALLADQPVLFSAAHLAAAPWLFAATAGLPAIVPARENARRASSMSNLRQLVLGCVLYADDHDGTFAAPDGAAGLSQLKDYMGGWQVFVHPAQTGRAAPADAKAITEAQTSYAYVGGGLHWRKMEKPSISPILFEKPGIDPRFVNVAFMDGHVESIAMRAESCEGIVRFLAERDDWPAAMLELYLKKAKALDEAL